MDEACTRHYCAVVHCCLDDRNYSFPLASTACIHITGECGLLYVLTLFTGDATFQSYCLLVDLNSCFVVLQLPLQSSYSNAILGVLILLRMPSLGRSWHCTLNSQLDLFHLDPFNFGSFLRQIAARTYHRTICSLDDVHLHFSISFLNNAFIEQEKIDFRINNLSLFISYHFSCKYLSLLDCTGLRY